MRCLILIATLIVPGLALSANVASNVLTYECAMTDLERDGFECLGTRDASGITILEIKLSNQEGLPAKQLAEQNYKFSRFILQYFQLGGGRFDLTFANKPGITQRCHRSKHSFSYYCDEPR